MKYDTYQKYAPLIKITVNIIEKRAKNTLFSQEVER